MGPRRAGLWRFALAVGGAVAAGLAAGALGAWIGYQSGGGEDAGKWGDLGRALGAFIVGFLFGVPTLLVLVTIAVRRTVGEGRRLATAVAVLAALAATPVLFAAIGRDASRGGVELLGPAVALLVVAALATGVASVAGHLAHRRASTVTLAAAAAVGLLIVVAAVRGEAVADERRREGYEQEALPLALIDGATLELDVAGWDIRYVGTAYDGQVTVHYDVEDPRTGRTWGTYLHLERLPEEVECELAVCEEVGRRGDAPILGRRHPYLPDKVTDVWVDVPGGRWRVASYADIDVAVAVDLLQALEPVDAATFVARTPG